MMKGRADQRGAVSLFIVIFAALLIITVVTAFIRIMIQDQMQATASDLARSAYDSAQAGVEDVKRAITEYQDLKCAENTTTPRCTVLANGLGTGDWTTGCNATVRAGIATLDGNGEVPVKTNSNDGALAQAYTCVKVNMQTDDVIGDGIYPLQAVGGNNAIDAIEVEWSYQDENQNFSLDFDTSEIPANWLDIPRPSVLRLQLIQFEDKLTLSDLDAANTDNSNSAYNRTLFFVPTKSTVNINSFINDDRPNTESAVVSDAVRKGVCRESVTSGNYACRAKITLPALSGAGPDVMRNAYLRVDRLYAENDDGPPKVKMLNDAGKALKFNGVQIGVDSTGRAGDVFKRIRTRLNVGGANMPLMAVDTTKSLCKYFAVTDTSAEKLSGYPIDCPSLPN